MIRQNSQRILYLAHRIPYPPNKGDKIRSFHQIRYLAERHNLYLACFVDDPVDLQYASALKEYCEAVRMVSLDRKEAFLGSLAALLSGQPLSVGYYASRAMKRAVKELLGMAPIDLALVFSSTMAQYIPDHPNFRILMDFVDVDSEKWFEYAKKLPFPKSTLYRIEGSRLARYEEAVARRSDRSLFVSEAEMAVFARRFSSDRLAVVRNGVDVDYFCPREEGAATGMVPRLTFVGAMDYLPNTDAVMYFVSRILPRIREHHPDVEFFVVGRNPVPEILALAERDRGIRVVGTVPDVRPYLEKTFVAVAPLRIARGIQNKVLEAMAMGLPVVATPEAFEGLHARPGEDLFVASDPETFAATVVRLLYDHEERRRIGRNARETVVSQYGWSTAIEELEALL